MEPQSKKTLCIDIDGTICVQTRGEYEKAEPFEAARTMVNKLYDEGFRIIFFTARYMGRFGDAAKAVAYGYETTLNQLRAWGFKFHALHFGKPPHHILIDDKALFYQADWNAIYQAVKAKEHEDIY